MGGEHGIVGEREKAIRRTIQQWAQPSTRRAFTVRLSYVAITTAHKEGKGLLKEWLSDKVTRTDACYNQLVHLTNFEIETFKPASDKTSTKRSGSGSAHSELPAVDHVFSMSHAISDPFRRASNTTPANCVWKRSCCPSNKSARTFITTILNTDQRSKAPSARS